MNPLVELVQALFDFLLAAPYAKFLSFLIFLLLLIGLYKVDRLIEIFHRTLP